MKSFPAYILVFLGSMLLSNVALRAQSALPIATNENVTATIFFPSNISKVVPPATNFDFQYEENSRIGLLKGRKGKPSNLLVITDDGYAYSFAVKYSEEIQKFNFILTTDQAVSHTNSNRSSAPATASNQEKQSGDPDSDPKNTATNDPLDTDQNPETLDSDIAEANGQVILDTNTIDTLNQQHRDTPANPPKDENWESKEDDLYDSDREEYIRIYCENNYLQKPAILRVFRQNKRILLQLNNILVDRNEKYFVLQIENNSRKEFDVEGISFFRKSAVGQLQKIMTPLYTFNLQEKIDPDSINEIVLVFKNFTISSKEEIIVVLADVDYDKMVKLPLKNIIVNFPSN